jgi:hypothetical protein
MEIMERLPSGFDRMLTTGTGTVVMGAGVQTSTARLLNTP